MLQFVSVVCICVCQVSPFRAVPVKVGSYPHSGGYHTHDLRVSQMLTKLHIEIKGYYCHTTKVISITFGNSSWQT